MGKGLRADGTSAFGYLGAGRHGHTGRVSSGILMHYELLIAAGLIAILLLALEAGFRYGRHAKREHEAATGGQLGAVQGAVLGLLGLLLGFSFAGAASRFLERQDLIVREANAIGTAALRCDLLDEPQRSELRNALRDYTAHRLEVSARLEYRISPDDLRKVEDLHNRIWHAASAGVAAKPADLLAVIPAVNDVIDLHSLRVAAGHKHLPLLVLGLLVACSGLAMIGIGYGCGLSERRHRLLTWSLALLIATALWTTIDLDYPRAGLIKINDAPLAELKF